MTTSAEPTSRVAILDEFLVAQEWRGLLDFTFSHGTEFRPTQVISHGGDHLNHDIRRSVVLFELGPFRELFARRLMTFLPQVLRQLDLEWFPVTHIEAQLTGSGDGEFFRAHSDNGSLGVSARAVTFVYFFHREPCSFSGGELRIWDTPANSEAESGEENGAVRSIPPQQNQVVFFPSFYLHEIAPVSCPSGNFADRRFTVNGWLHR
jgi:Rps23 Pro-64 3,4-dihydroxylase Tpa1-like proline 4-hydroxylase